ncbi:MAG TPA: alkaline phosphatase family protein [Terracidiphilus sp.]|nr:alkaline phosphatase family protein [Terracidiphilus sp.]
MSRFHVRALAGLALVATLTCSIAKAYDGDDDRDDRDHREIKHVFVIALENHNWTQPTTVTGGIQPIFQNASAPFINSLVSGTATAYINGQLVNISKQTSYAKAYYNVLAGTGKHIHPSEPNYIWAEAGTNFGIANDDDPFKDSTPNSQNTTQHLSGLLQKAGISWKSYQEDIDLQTVNGQLTNLPLSPSQWTSPIVSLSGKFAANSNLNEYNSSLQYNYAVKHNPQAFFNDTNGGNNTTTSNTERFHYAPLQQLAFDLQNDRVAAYNWITPNQYNDMHSALSGGFAGLTGDSSQIKAGDNAVSRLVPMIMASRAYKDGGVIIVWWDESEEDGEANDNADDFNHTIGEIIISPLAHENEGGLPYASAIPFSHSSDLRTMQEIFHVRATGGSSPWLGDAVNANDLSDLFQPGVIPTRP